MYFFSEAAVNQHRSGPPHQQESDDNHQVASGLVRSPPMYVAPAYPHPRGPSLSQMGPPPTNSYGGHGPIYRAPVGLSYPSLTAHPSIQQSNTLSTSMPHPHSYAPVPRQHLPMNHTLPDASTMPSRSAQALSPAGLPTHQRWQPSQLPTATPATSQFQQPSLNNDLPTISPSLTYTGHIKTSADAILLLAACDLPADASASDSSGSATATSPPPRRIQRRLLESERVELVKSGSVFVWDEDEAGMRRWTDGRCWSASRVSGCFLTYRELEARKRSAHDPTGPRANQYKIEGLIKQSFSMTTTSGRKVHIVSYYTKRDIREGRLGRVSEDPRFVGEAGGEWGLQIDEDEYPDPVLAMNQQNLEAADELAKKAQESTAPEAEVASPGTIGSPCDSAASKYKASSVFGPSPAGQSVTSPEAAKGPNASDVDQQGPVESHSTSRPPLKRLRSSSTGELKRLRRDDGPTVNTGITGNLLTESNMRHAGLARSAEQGEHRLQQRDHQLPPRRLSGGDMGPGKVSYPSLPQGSEQDGSAAAGALLSLRSFFGPPSALGRPSLPARTGVPSSLHSSSGDSNGLSSGSLLRLSSTRGYLDSGNESGTGSSGTPLTTPEDASPPEKRTSDLSAKKNASTVQTLRRRSDGTMATGERSDSDRDTLKRFGVRL